MDRAAEVLEALEARAEEKSLEELGRRGRSRVKVIRPSEIAGMLQEAVKRALSGSDYVSPDKVAVLVEEGRAEFQLLLTRREAELEESARQAHAFEETKSLLAKAEMRAAELEKELEELRRSQAEHEATAPQPEPQLGGAGAELLMKLMGEVLELKGKLAGAAQGQAQESGSGGALTEKLEQIVGALDSKIERLGRKVGVHGAVEGGQLSFEALFAHQDKKLENNLDTVKVQERSGAGIAANLEKMKKLRGKGN